MNGADYSPPPTEPLNEHPDRILEAQPSRRRRRDEAGPRYFAFMEAVYASPKPDACTTFDKGVLAYVVFRWFGNGHCSASMDRIAAEVWGSKRAVQMSLRRLEAAGMVRLVAGGGSVPGDTPVYEVDPDFAAAVATPTGAGDAPIDGIRVQEMHPTGAGDAPLRVQEMHPNPNPNPNLNNKGSRGEAKPVDPGQGGASRREEIVLRAWCEDITAPDLEDDTAAPLIPEFVAAVLAVQDWRREPTPKSLETFWASFKQRRGVVTRLSARTGTVDQRKWAARAWAERHG